MLLSEPRPSRWDLRGRMFGADLRIRPIFWASCVLLGLIFYQDPDFGGVAMFGMWLVAVLISILAHEFCHVVAARAFGVRPRIVLGGLGGQVYGLEEMKRGRRVLVLWAGSLGNALLFALFWGITDLALPEHWRKGLASTVWLFLWINAYWGLLNVLPLWPLDGGRAAVEIGQTLLGRRGETLALLLSLIVCLLLGLSVAWWARVALTNPIDPRYLIRLLFLGIQLLYCYIFWLCTFRALWGEATPHDELSRPERAA